VTQARHHRHVRHVAIAFFAVALSAAPLRAQQAPKAEDAIGQLLFPPELVMQHQQKIGLKPAQRTAITSAIQEVQAKVVDVQWKMQEEMQKLVELLQSTSVNESAALEQVDRLFSAEREIKRAHLGLLIRIKNTLTKEQQTTLQALK
jgi:Spy/CpxP family protein refolding chaperone